MNYLLVSSGEFEGPYAKESAKEGDPCRNPGSAGGLVDGHRVPINDLLRRLTEYWGGLRGE